MATKTKHKEELPLFDIKLNAFEIGILVGGLSKLDLKIAPRIWKVTEQFSK